MVTFGHTALDLARFVAHLLTLVEGLNRSLGHLLRPPFYFWGSSAQLLCTHLVGADWYTSTLRAELIVRAAITRKRSNVGAIRATNSPIHNV